MTDWEQIELRSPNGGFYYRNYLWYSDAFRVLTISARELLHCFLNELRWSGRGKKRVYTNNGELSFTEIQFKKLYGYSSATYLKARNKLIEVGLIRQTYQGGFCRGDRATYKVLCVDGVLQDHQRWQSYPKENWSCDIPKSKNTLVGLKTQFKKGRSGRQDKTHPISIGSKVKNLPTKVYP